MMRKKALLVGVLAALAGAAPAQVLAPEQPPELDPLAATEAGGEPIVVIRGTISEAGGVEISDTEIVVARPPATERAGHSDQAVLVELLGRDDEVLETVALEDPRVVHELEGNGETYLLDQAEFTATIAFEPDAAEVRMQEVELRAPPGGQGEAGSEPGEERTMMVPTERAAARAGLAEAVDAFCAANQNDEVCR